MVLIVQTDCIIPYACSKFKLNCLQVRKFGLMKKSVGLMKNLVFEWAQAEENLVVNNKVDSISVSEVSRNRIGLIVCPLKI